ncbi:MAG: hypothetical protein IJ210_15150 [Clostridia bacterium]|nr:hypothetical protein [Clostridia bacterium]
MRDQKTYNMDDAMRDVSALIEYFKRNAERVAGGPGSENARQMRMYALALTMVMDKARTDYYHIGT